MTTLGDLLSLKGSSREQDWARLVQSVAAGDHDALHALFDRTHRIVFTLAMHITANREIAGEATIEVFAALRRQASRYNAVNGTVLAWIMNQARSCSIERLRSGRRNKQRANVQRDTEMKSDAHGIINLREHSQTMRARLSRHTGGKTRKLGTPTPARWVEPEWARAAPGIEYQLLSTDTKRQRISMLVSLAPGSSYPSHTHASTEELHLLDGELWIDGLRLLPGDYNRGEPGAADERVWTETGCTCVLVTSMKDVLRLKRTGESHARPYKSLSSRDHSNARGRARLRP